MIELHINDVKAYSISPKEDYGNNVGDTEYLDNQFGLTPQKICEFIEKIEK